MRLCQMSQKEKCMIRRVVLILIQGSDQIRMDITQHIQAFKVKPVKDLTQMPLINLEAVFQDLTRLNEVWEDSKTFLEACLETAQVSRPKVRI